MGHEVEVEAKREARKQRIEQIKDYGVGVAGLLGVLAVTFLFGVFVDKKFDRRPDGSRN